MDEDQATERPKGHAEAQKIVPERQQQVGSKTQSQKPSPEEASSGAEMEVAPESMGPEDVASRPSSSDLPPAGGEPPMFVENRNKYIIIGLAVVFFLIILFVVIKIFTGRGGNQEKVNLIYWGLWEEAEIYKPLIEEYKRDHSNVEIEYVKMDPANYREKIIERSRNNQGPDIFRFHNTWLPSLADVVAQLPKNIMSDEEFENIFYQAAQKDLRVGDFYYGLPLEIDGLVLVYNNDMFKRAGIEVSPASWEDVINYSAQLTVKDRNGQIITSGIALGTASNVEHFSDIFGYMLLQNSGDLGEKSKEDILRILSNLNNPEGVGALKAYRKFAEPPGNVWNGDMPNSLTAFIEGKVAMIIVPSWEILSIKKSNPDIDFKVTALPTVPGGNQVALANYWVEGVSKFSDYQLEAWKFLRFLVEKENLTKLYEESTKTRLFGEPYSRVDLASILVQNEYLGPVIQQAKYMISLPLISRTYDNGLNDEIVKYLEDAINNTVKGVSYEEALRRASVGINQVYEKYGIVQVTE